LGFAVLGLGLHTRSMSPPSAPVPTHAGCVEEPFLAPRIRLYVSPSCLSPFLSPPLSPFLSPFLSPSLSPFLPPFLSSFLSPSCLRGSVRATLERGGVSRGGVGGCRARRGGEGRRSGGFGARGLFGGFGVHAEGNLRGRVAARLHPDENLR
jgi:hypothetical protein